MRNKTIPLSLPVFDGREMEYVTDAFKERKLATEGRFLERKSELLNTVLGGKEHIALLNSGTSAILIGLQVLGVGFGDEVICQSFTFAASANPIVQLGALPIFVDSEKDTWNIDPDLLQETILDRIAHGKKPKAIVVVDLFGMPAKFDEILAVANKFEIPVLEDAAEALGSYFKGRACGTLGDMGVISFNSNKIITCSGGGALISKNKTAIDKAVYLSLQAKEKLPYYEYWENGYNAHMTNMAAAVGLAQLENLERKLFQRKQVFQWYKELLGNSEGISFMEEKDDIGNNRWLTTILINTSLLGVSVEEIRQELLEKGIESRRFWKPLHTQPVFLTAPKYGGSICEELFSVGLCLPSSEDLTKEDVERISEVLLDKVKMLA